MGPVKLTSIADRLSPHFNRELHLELWLPDGNDLDNHAVSACVREAHFPAVHAGLLKNSTLYWWVFEGLLPILYEPRRYFGVREWLCFAVPDLRRFDDLDLNRRRPAGRGL